MDIWAGGIEKDVTFVEEADPSVADRRHAVYLTNYRRHGAQYVDTMVTARARAATIKLVPRDNLAV